MPYSASSSKGFWEGGVCKSWLVTRDPKTERHKKTSAPPAAGKHLLSGRRHLFVLEGGSHKGADAFKVVEAAVVLCDIIVVVACATEAANDYGILETYVSADVGEFIGDEAFQGNTRDGKVGVSGKVTLFDGPCKGIGEHSSAGRFSIILRISSTGITFVYDLPPHPVVLVRAIVGVLIISQAFSEVA